MKVAVYVLRNRKGWEINLSLDLEVDQLWREFSPQEEGDLNAGGGILLGSAFPLPWAFKLCRSFRSQPVMDSWTLQRWGEYTAARLHEDLAAELPRVNGAGLERERALGRVNRWNDGQGRSGDGIAVAEGEGVLVWQKLQRGADELAGLLAGRKLLVPELEALLAEAAPALVASWRAAAQLAHLQGRLGFAAGLSPAPHASRARRSGLCCRRCGSVAGARTACASCGLAGCAYCEACLALGRSRACSLLLHAAAAVPAMRSQAGDPAPTAALERWGLSPAQRAATEAALRFLAAPAVRAAARPAAPAWLQRLWAASGQPPHTDRRFLLWAVTGAGKTEMIFPLLDEVIQRGGSALVASPRRDVVLELAPRLAKAFPDVEMALLYGGSPERWKKGKLTLATTHQLLRFHQAFDLVIVDEIDAFPYHNDPMLAFAAEQACLTSGKFIYLSATPPAALQREARQGKLAHARVPVRFHRYPLPVPVRLVGASLSRCLQQRRLPSSLLSRLQESLTRGAQVFLFATRISQIDPLVKLLADCFPDVRVAGTSSQDPDRSAKVSAFRNTDIRLLVTTTILERGVTVPRSDVYILDANDTLFDEASLVQMAGRAGRSKDDPKGKVVFVSPEWTKGQKQAIAHIRSMNALASKLGYLR
ncbi:helicase-related protein [Paenibacillus sp. P96]|uniref:Helicase-related protein n=1 Tax=Paenibacillus zeirhizosphaerae TaxID=2987519 RepID=A0ABT9FVR0_9BACL|nr:helicase-related protein [Paenibacillus sp. P96]MDP4098606.1 helicase-related protein [Paenibacillus sp. P96]